MDIIDYVVLAIAGYFIFDFVRAYRGTVGSVWSRCIGAAKSSATILWARFTVVVTALAAGLVQIADFIQAPSVSAAISTYLKPSVVAAIMVTVAVVTEWARRRTL
ncbi:MAG TPA: hypothetical protein VH678_20575 [Xanthobacteraceae bacterium]|jgi:hypothetical protein